MRTTLQSGVRRQCYGSLRRSSAIATSPAHVAAAGVRVPEARGVSTMPAFGQLGCHGVRRFTTPMHRSQLCADWDSGCTIPPMRTPGKARQLLRIVFGVMSVRVARCQCLLISCALRGPSSSLDCSSTWNSRKAPQMLAFLRADRSRRPYGFDDCCGERQQAMETARCVARPPVCENYVKVSLTALGHGPRNSSITRPER